MVTVDTQLPYLLTTIKEKDMKCGGLTSGVVSRYISLPPSPENIDSGTLTTYQTLSTLNIQFLAVPPR